MLGVVAIVGAVLAFLVPMAVPLFAQRWLTFGKIVGVGSIGAAWLIWDIQTAAPGTTGLIGPFLGGLMLLGFAAGAIAKFSMLLGRRSG